MAASLSGAEVLLAAWAHGGLDVKKPAVKGNKVEYTSCVGDVCTKHAFVPLPTDGGRTFAPSTALVVRLITSPVAFAIVPVMGFLAFVSLTSSRPTNHLLALLDNPYATGAAHPVLGLRPLADTRASGAEITGPVRPAVKDAAFKHPLRSQVRSWRRCLPSSCTPATRSSCFL